MACCKKPKLLFIHNVTQNREEIFCTKCGISFWNYETDQYWEKFRTIERETTQGKCLP